MRERKRFTESDHYLGPLDASIFIIEYADFECPYSARAHDLIKLLMKEFPELICYIYRHFPLTNVHPNSGVAAVASEAAARQGRFWEMHDAFFDFSDALTTENIFLIARHLKLNMKKFLLDLEDEALAQRVRRDFHSALRSGVKGTPTFIVNGTKMDGIPSYRALKNIVKEHRTHRRRRHSIHP
jgi:protein-disulfide isomerase